MRVAISCGCGEVAEEEPSVERGATKWLHPS
jgi:hypothetical protein